MLRRTATAPHGEQLPTPKVGAVRLEPVRRTVLAEGEPVQLRAKEVDLLRGLMHRPGRVFSRSRLLSAVWGQVEYASGRTVDVHTAQLRARLGDASRVRTARGVGRAAGA